jgi:hypothetical protein
MLVMEGPLLITDLAAKRTRGYDSDLLGTELATTRSNVTDFIADLGSFAMICHRSLQPEEARAVEVGIGKMFLASAEKRSAIRAERNPSNDTSSQTLPPVLRKSLRRWLQDDLMISYFSKAKGCCAPGKVWTS